MPDGLIGRALIPCLGGVEDAQDHALAHVSGHMQIATPPDQIVGIVPPSMTYSLPVIDEARSDARNATKAATSSGRFGLPKGMPPRVSMILCRAASGLM